MALEGQKVFVVGGTSGIGLEIARLARERGAVVTVAGRSAEKREAAARELGQGAGVVEIDVTSDDSVSATFKAAGRQDHVVCTAPGAAVGRIADLDTETGQAAFNAKFWGAFRTAKYAQITDTGTLTLISGQMARRPRAGVTLGGCVNAAVEALVRGLAGELSPIRVNAISPGFIDTPLHSRLGEEQRAASYQSAADRLPVHRVGRPQEIASMAIEVMQNGFLTGATIQVDGGAMVV